MKQGALIFDERSDRYDIRFDLADYYRHYVDEAFALAQEQKKRVDGIQQGHRPAVFHVAL